ncbi:MAG: hypothetical protein ACK4K0_10800 [Flavobacteriales bacterium]
MKLIFIALTFSITFSSIAQMHEKGTFQAKFGYGNSVYGTLTTTTLKTNNTSFSSTDTSGAVTSHFPIELKYGLGDRFSIGLYGRFGRYLYDTADVKAKENKFSAFGIATEFYAVNKEKWNLYFNLGFHTVNLMVIEKPNPLVTTEGKYKGTGIKAGIGTNIMLFKPVALNFNLGYDGNNLNLKEYYVNQNKQDLSNIDVNLVTKGVRYGIGLNILIK